MPIVIDKPSIISSAGNKPKVIEEYVGRVNSKTDALSIARMKSPSGWVEPGQRPEFDEYTVVIRGELHIKTENSSLEIKAGSALLVPRGEWVQYSTPGPDGAEYIAVCHPAFSLEAVHRDE
jgi:ethanolamine utilization protein EutQ (cupin superfamily)